MRILLINPNTSAGGTERMLATARRAAAATTEVVGRTAARGVAHVTSRADALVGGAAALEMVAEHGRDADAMIVAAFVDTWLEGLRDLAPVPVIGLAEAAMLTACMLGRRFSILTFARPLGPWYEECVEYHGLTSRLAAIRLLDALPQGTADTEEALSNAVIEAARQTAEEDRTDAVILAGPPLIGLAETIRDRAPLPLVDGIAAAVRQAEMLVAMRPRQRASPPRGGPDRPRS